MNVYIFTFFPTLIANRHSPLTDYSRSNSIIGFPLFYNDLTPWSSIWTGL